MELFKARQEFNKILKENNIADYENNTAQIFLHVLKINKAELLTKDTLTVSEYNKIKKLILKRAKHYPLQYILKQVEFYGNKIKVNKNVLIPRNETEQLCELVAKKANNKTVLDLCCGSGCIGLGIKRNSNAEVTLCDVSSKALCVAKLNAKKNRLNVKIVKSDLFKNIKNKYDIIVSNPPYIKSDEIKCLQSEIKFEPVLALDGKDDGLYYYRQIINNAPNVLNENGEIFLEFGVGQCKTLENLLSKDFECIKIVKDYYNKNRFICAKLKGKVC